ncbi:hypothetical protein A4X09_0g6588 [Tilletia walkeri]|uniref:Uncharacterized protein n=1 Tax=Tilletia walkeri TaxID=117179 RepID=A0A8X7N3I5_9BASI|nr:hypothetical protein A4X09_0g6588 [Tilletia walkeri]
MRLTTLFVALALASGAIANSVVASAAGQGGSVVANKATQPGSASVEAISNNGRMEKRLLMSSAPDATNANVKATHEQPQRVPSDSFKPSSARASNANVPKTQAMAADKDTKKHKDGKKEDEKKSKSSSSKKTSSHEKRGAGHAGRPNGRPAGNRPAHDFASNSNTAWRRAPKDAHRGKAKHHKAPKGKPKPASPATHGPAKDFADQRNTAW